MKERSKGFLSGVIVSALLVGCAGTALAAYQKQATLDYTGIQITLNGQTITPTDAAGNTVEPFAIEGTTYLPVRGIANALGLGVEWDGATQTVKLTNGQGQSQTPATPTGTYSRTNPAPVGTAQSINVDTYSEKYNASVVIVESVRGDAAWKLVQEASMINAAAPEGQEYVVVKVKISLNSVTDDKAISFSQYSFDPFSKDNVEYKDNLIIAPDPRLSGSVYAGGTTEGYAVYCVDKTDTAPKLSFGAKYDGTGGIWFAMTK